MNKIIICNIRLAYNSGNLRAFADVEIDDVVIMGFRIIQEEGKHPWVSMPQIPYKDKKGKTKYFDMIGMSEKLERLVAKEVLKAWNCDK